MECLQESVRLPEHWQLREAGRKAGSEGRRPHANIAMTTHSTLKSHMEIKAISKEKVYSDTVLGRAKIPGHMEVSLPDRSQRVLLINYY